MFRRNQTINKRKIMKRAESLKQIIEHHFNGGKFLYDSYDHQKAELEFKGTSAYQGIVQIDLMLNIKTTKIDKLIIPEEIRDKYPILKSGKLRSIDFASDGSIRHIKIGNKRPMNFYNWSANKVTLL